MNKVIVSSPPVNALGGVSSYIKSIIPGVTSFFDVAIVEVGSAAGDGKYFHFFQDQYAFSNALSDGCDLVHINPSLNFKSLIRDGLFLLQAKRKGCPVLVFFHGWEESTQGIIGKYFKTLFRSVFSRADALIVLASDFESVLREWGIKGVIHRETTSVEMSLLDGFNLENVLSERSVRETVKVLFLARLERDKGLFQTIEAVLNLHKKGYHISLTIAGDGPERENLEAALIELNDESRGVVDFVGYITGQKKVDAFVNHDIYCFPTFYGEGLPTSVLEAMAFGMPVITSSVGGLADMFEDKKMGRLITSSDSNELEVVLEGLVSSRESCEEISRYNYDCASNNFLSSVVSVRIKDIYTSLIDGSVK